MDGLERQVRQALVMNIQNAWDLMELTSPSADTIVAVYQTQDPQPITHTMVWTRGV